MADVFISYSREDITFARKLHRALENKGMDTWIDWQDILPSAQWINEIYEAIEQADAFVLILSNKSVSSEICSKEVAFAIDNNKRLIPIVIDEIHPEILPNKITELNWIFFRETDDFEDSLGKLIAAIHTDQAWVKDHTRYYKRALEWDRHSQDDAFMLRGGDISEAEIWLSLSGGREPAPTELHRGYILSSRMANTRRQRRVFGFMTFGLLIAIALSILAFYQRNITQQQADYQTTAEAQAVAEVDMRGTANAIAFMERDSRATAQAETQIQLDIALSKNLAAKSLLLNNHNLDLKLLLSVAAVQYHPGAEAYNSLHAAILAEEYFSGIVMDDPNIYLKSVVLNADGSRLAVGSQSGEIRVVEAQTGKVLHTFSSLSIDESIVDLAISNDGKKLVSVSETGTTQYWDLSFDHDEGVVLSDYADWESFLAINSNGSEIAALTTHNQVAIWDPLTGLKLQVLDNSDSQTRLLVFSQDGTQLAGFNGRESVHVWNRETGEKETMYLKLGDRDKETYDRHPLNAQYSLAFHPKGAGLLIGTGHQTIYWDFLSDELMSSDASYLIGFDSENDPVGFFLSDGGVYQKEIINDGVSSSEININFGGDPTGPENLGYLFSAFSEDFFVVWQRSTGGVFITRYTMLTWTPVGRVISETGGLRAIATVPNAKDNLIISAGCAEPVSVIDCNSGVVKFWAGEDWDLDGDPIIAHRDWISSVAVNPDGTQFITASEDGTLLNWDLVTREPYGNPIEVDFIGIDSRLEYHPSGKYAALYDGWNRIYLIDVEGWTLVGEPFSGAFTGEAESLRGFAFSPDGRSMAVIHLGESSSLEINPDHSVYGLLFSDYNLTPDGSYAIVLHERAILAIWRIDDIANPQLANTVTLKDNPADESKLAGWVRLKDFYPVDFHPDGSKIIVGMDGMVILLDPSSGQTLYASSDNEILNNTISDIVYDPSGQFVAVARCNGTLQLRDGDSGFEKVVDIMGSGYIQDSVVFSQTSDLLFNVFFDSKIYFEQIGLNTLTETACNMVNRPLTPDEWQQFLPGVEYQEVCAQTP